ncbi:MAG: hypothetical protein R3C99_25510 [Pirellulaceae bacterium]
MRFTTNTPDLERVTQVQVLLDGSPLDARSPAGVAAARVIEPNVWLHTYTFSHILPAARKASHRGSL